MNTDIFNYLILPLLIFIARVSDVSLGTLRIIFVSKGNKLMAPLLGFFEVLIWIIAISRILQHLNNPLYYIAYAAGFSAGNYIGLLIEAKLALGEMIIRIITPRKSDEIMHNLHEAGFGTTIIQGGGSMGKVNIIYSVVHRNDLKKAEEAIQKGSADAFYSIEDIKVVNRGIFPTKNKVVDKMHLFRWRKGK
ncbi:MAG: DUF2179 domain-containing protein [Bacteroidota bacterium]